MQLLIKLCFLFYLFNATNDLYTIHITTIDGADKTMADFQGRKILVVVLPVSKSSKDSTFLISIDSLSKVYAQQMAVIGVPSFEDGYTSANSNELRHYYHSLLSSNVTVTRGMYTRKAAGENQHSLFRWLTHANLNSHFDSDVAGSGQRFFISEQGELYAVIDPDGVLSAKVMEFMINRRQ